MKRYVILHKGGPYPDTPPSWSTVCGYVTSEEYAIIYCNHMDSDYYFLEADETHPLYNSVDAFNFDYMVEFFKEQEETNE